jgi:hypothetical protein
VGGNVMTDTTNVQSLTPKVRHVVFAVSVSVSVALGLGCVTASYLLARIWFALWWIGLSALFWSVFRTESELANNHLCTIGQVISRRRTKLGIEVRYSYIAPDSRNYEGKSRLGKWSDFEEGKSIPVLFNPLRPEISKPQGVFMFYRFETGQ